MDWGSVGVGRQEREQLVIALGGRAVRPPHAGPGRTDAGECERGPILVQREMLQLAAWTSEMRPSQERIVMRVAALFTALLLTPMHRRMIACDRISPRSSTVIETLQGAVTRWPR